MQTHPAPLSPPPFRLLATLMRRGVTCAMAAGLLMSITACEAPSPAQLGERARTAMDEGDYAAAIIDLKTLLQAEPGNIDAQLMLGDSLLAEGDPAAAAKQYERARELGASRDRWLGGWLGSLLQQQRHDEVIAATDALEDVEPGLAATVAEARGFALLGRGEPHRAAGSFRAAVAAAPDNSMAHANLARVLDALGQKEQADAAIAQALRLDPRNSSALMLHGERLFERGQPDAAIQSFADAADAAAERGDWRLREPALAQLVEAQLAAGKNEDARSNYQLMAAEFPAALNTVYLRARIAAQDERYQDARNLLQAVLAEDENHRPAQRLLGTIHALEGKYDLAELYLRPVVASSPQDLFARQLLAMVRVRQDRPREALEILDSETGEDPAEFWAMAGRASLRAGDAGTALKYFDAGLLADPSDWRFQLGKSAALLADGDYDQALALLEALPAEAPAELRATLTVVAHLQRGQNAEAIAETTRLAREYPAEAWAHNLLGAVQLLSGDLDAADRAVSRALALDSDNQQALANRVRIADRLQQPARALAALRELVRNDPSDAVMAIRLARLELEQGNGDRAVELLLPRQELHPAARRLLGRIWLDRGETERALTMARTALDANDNDHEAHNLMGLVAQARRDYANARRHFGRAMELAPGEALYRANLARAQFSAGLDREADNTLSGGVSTLATAPELQLLRLTRHIAAGEFDAAGRVLRRLREDGADAALLTHLEGDIAFAQRNFARAATLYGQAYRQRRSAQVAVKAGLAAARAGRPDPLAQVSDWLASNPRDYATTHAAAVIRHELGDLDAARALYERVLAVNDAHVSALNNLAWIYQEQGDSRAVATAERALALAPDNASLLDTLGWSLFRDGQAKRAVQVLRNASERAPENAEIRYHLAEALAATGERDAAGALLRELLDSGEPFASRDAARERLESL